MASKKKLLAGLAAGAVVGALVARRAQRDGGVAEESNAGRPGALHKETPVGPGTTPGVPFPDHELLRECVHCGFCLPTCPTYAALGLEADSPRGRIHQMELVVQGVIDPADPHLYKHIYQCLDCRACETACPSGVKYGRLVEGVRSIMPPRSVGERVARKVMIAELLTQPLALNLAGSGARLYQRSGLQKVVRATGVLRVAPALRRMEAMLPELEGPLVLPESPTFVPAQGKRRHRVAFLTGCVAAQFFPQTNCSTLAVLAVNGCEVVVPPDQTCCGALANHSGDREKARACARRNIDAFEGADADFVVTNAAGCGSMLKEYGYLLADDPAYAERARRFAAKVRDISELLAALPLRPPERPLRRRVTYQEACHLRHGQKIKDAPRQVLRAIPGLELVEMRNADWCCGSAGIYNVTQPALSEEILSWKIESIAATGADTVSVANPGCIIQLEHGLRDRGMNVRAVHPVDLLAEAYGLGVTSAAP